MVDLSIVFLYVYQAGYFPGPKDRELPGVFSQKNGGVLKWGVLPVIHVKIRCSLRKHPAIGVPQRF